MRERTIITLVVLEIYALILANVQALGGVRTDEAKYLLNIPYPHPPFLRTIMSWTELVPFHEMLWRVLLASLLVQAVWLIWDMGRDLQFNQQIALIGSWLLSTGLILQGGSVMMATVTALQGIVLLWLTQRRELVKNYPGIIALFWLACLFTAYQAVLYFPLLWLAYTRADVHFRQKLQFVFIPILLLALYTVTNPLAVATMVIHSEEGARVTSIADRLTAAMRLWLVGGSAIISLAGTVGIFLTGTLAFIGSFVLVFAFNTLSNPYPFYAILFTPLFVAGVHYLLRAMKKWETFPLLILFLAGAVVCTLLWKPSHKMSPARETMQAILKQEKTGGIAVVGSFGHEWQYESPVPLSRFRKGNTNDLQAVICTDTCGAPADRGWQLLPDTPVRVWIKQ